MRTTLIFLSCLLVITGANLRRKCNNKAEKISSEDCKQYCNVISLPGYTWDCVKCVVQHQDYDKDCQGTELAQKCFKTDEDIAKENCDNCVFSEFCDPCETCINKGRKQDFLDSGISCQMLVRMGVTPPPDHPPCSFLHDN